MQGWIKLHRKLLENPIWEDPHYLKLWIYCLMKATHKEREVILGNQIIILQPGEFITGRKALSEDLNKGTKPKLKLNESTWWRYLNNLEKLQMLNIKKTNKYSVVTILNWNEYQESEHQMNNKRTSDEQQMNTNKNVKNDKNEKNNIVVAEQQAQNDEIDILLNRYIQLRGSGFSYSPIDVEAAKHILSSGVPLNSALTYMEELMQSYIPKYPGDKINSLKYCVGYILDRYYKEKAKEGASNVLPINRGSYGRTKSQNKSKPEPILGEDFVGRVPRNRA